jgi:hypothetical protein
VSDLQDAINAVAPFLHRHRYAVVVGALPLESFGLPLPDEPTRIEVASLAVAGSCIFCRCSSAPGRAMIACLPPPDLAVR